MPLPPEIEALVPDLATPAAARAILEKLGPRLALPLTDRGLLPAAVRPAAGDGDPTHYDAVWVRDSVWGYLALRALPATRPEALRLLRALVAYFATPAQRARVADCLADPALARDPMRVPHIRFDARSPDFADVQVGGKPQTWNHKQNDALGLFLGAAWDAVAAGELAWDSLSAAEREPLLRLPHYLVAVGFESMEDAGAWEEIERVNSSSVGLVTWAHERALAAGRLEGDTAALGAAIDRGYARLERQLPHESPDYPPGSPRYREADAALLALCYPARLERLAAETRVEILEKLAPLIGEMGIRRYLGDAYQAAGYWLETGGDGAHDARTDDFSAEAAFTARARGVEPGTEAQWFFDSWLSKAYGVLWRETGRNELRRKQLQFLERALAQFTPADPTGADGISVPSFSLPESWNTVVWGDARGYAPSPITPLNWAKASLTLALVEATTTS